jgi:TonB-linked SusC/RagA family outer membrane protein
MKTKFNGFLALVLALVVQISFAQEKTVTGTVSDANGPLPGVTVIVKGTNTGTQTDFDGNYSINAAVGAVLQFSFVGMQTEERTVGSANTINVVMRESAEALEEVVVTALGIKREKQSLGYAQQTVSGDELVRTRETDISNALAGKVAGVQFIGAASSGFGNSSIRLRGDTNIMYVVDGIILSASADINTDEIAEMSVLKGAAATALYGPDGINGVIVITTKTAQSGQSTVEINHSTAFENVYLLPEYQNEYGGGYSQDFNVFSFNPAQHPAEWAAFDGQLMVEYYADESWGPRMDGTLVRHWDSWIPGDPEFGKLRPFSPNPDNIKDFYDTGITNNTQISYSKGGEDYSIRATLANIDRTSVSPNSDRNTTQATINADLNITDKIRAYANVNYQDRRTKNFPDEGYTNLGSNFNQWWQRQLDMDRLRDYRRNGAIVSWNINSPTNLQPLYWDMPFFETHENLNFQDKNAIYGRFGLEYNVIEDLTVNVEVKKTMNSFESNNRFAWDGLGTPFYSENESINHSHELFAIANYDKQLTEDIDLQASLGYQSQIYGSKSIAGSTVGGLTTYGFYSLNTSKDRPNLSSSRSALKRRAFFGKASFGYKGILYLDGSARLDWASSSNPDDNRIETFGGSASFIFSKLTDIDWLSFGKLRGSFAQAPLFAPAGATNVRYDVTGPFGTYGALSVQGTYPNTGLTGGVREEFEIGTELKFLSNRVGIDFTYFEKTDKELPKAVSLDAATGYTSTRSNQGEQLYKGIELGINFVPFQTEDFEWDANLNFATLTREVVAIADGIDSNVLSASWRGIQLREQVGEEWGAIYGRAFRRDDAGNKILSSTGSPRYDTNQYLGNVLPDFTGGMSNNVRYKNFNLGFDLDFQKGGLVFSVTRMFNNYSGLGTETIGNNALGNPVRDPVAGTGAWYYTPAAGAASNSGGVLIEGVDETSGAPASYYVDPVVYWSRLFALHERWLYDASYVKLRTVRLDYDFSKEMLENTPFKDVNVGVFANNVWMIHTEIPGLDTSEIESFTGVNWTEGGQLPNVRTIGVNVKLTF